MLGVGPAWPQPRHSRCMAARRMLLQRVVQLCTAQRSVGPQRKNECCQQWMAQPGTRWNGCTTASGGLSAHRLDPKLGASHYFTGRTPTLSSVLLRQHEVVSVSKQRRPQAVSKAPTPHTYDRRRIRRQVEARIVRTPQPGAHR